MQFGKLLGNKEAPKHANPIMNAMMTAGQPKEQKHISKAKMESLLNNEYNPAKLEEQLKNCCSEHDKCSGDLKELAEGIEKLQKLKPAKLAAGVEDMENALQEKCHQIKESRAMIT
jgi:succinate dehydrogenase/fumarate reductase flavoprotein subunit